MQKISKYFYRSLKYNLNVTQDATCIHHVINYLQNKCNVKSYIFIKIRNAQTQHKTLNINILQSNHIKQNHASA